MRYLPHTPEDIAEMLQAVGVESFDEIFVGIPPECRRSRAMDLFSAIDQMPSVAMATGGTLRWLVKGDQPGMG